LKYAGATAAIVGASVLGLDYLFSSSLKRPIQTLNSTLTESISSTTQITSSTTTVSTTSVPESTLTDLDDPKSGFPQLANEIRKLPDFHVDTPQSSEAVRRIATLALQSDDPQVMEAFNLMLAGGRNNELPSIYVAPRWNSELQTLYWLAEQNEFKKNDLLALAVAMVNGIWVSMGTQDVQQAVYQDSSDMLNFLRETNDIQKASGFSQLENYPLAELVALAWTGNDLGRGGHIHYCLISGSCSNPSSTPLNIHHFIENENRNVTLRDYQWNTVSVSTLRQMRYEMSQRWLSSDVTQTANNLEAYFYVGPGSAPFSFAHWMFTEPNDAMIEVSGEETINHNMNNANFEYQYFTNTQGGIGVCDDNMTLINAFLKSCGIASTALTRSYGTLDGLNHTHAIYYDPASDSWKANGNELSIGFTDTGFSTNWNVYISRPPVLQHDFFDSQPDSLQKGMRMLNVYHKMLGINCNQVTSMFENGVPSSTTHEWFLTLS
jgi:hypothetical protein